MCTTLTKKGPLGEKECTKEGTEEAWSSCEEWCLSVVSSVSVKIKSHLFVYHEYTVILITDVTIPHFSFSRAKVVVTSTLLLEKWVPKSGLRIVTWSPSPTLMRSAIPWMTLKLSIARYSHMKQVGNFGEPRLKGLTKNLHQNLELF